MLNKRSGAIWFLEKIRSMVPLEHLLAPIVLALAVVVHEPLDLLGPCWLATDPEGGLLVLDLLAEHGAEFLHPCPILVLPAGQKPAGLMLPSGGPEWHLQCHPGLTGWFSSSGLAGLWLSWLFVWPVSRWWVAWCLWLQLGWRSLESPWVLGGGGRLWCLLLLWCCCLGFFLRWRDDFGCLAHCLVSECGRDVA